MAENPVIAAGRHISKLLKFQLEVRLAGRPTQNHPQLASETQSDAIFANVCFKCYYFAIILLLFAIVCYCLLKGISFIQTAKLTESEGTLRASGMRQGSNPGPWAPKWVHLPLCYSSLLLFAIVCYFFCKSYHLESYTPGLLLWQYILVLTGTYQYVRFLCTYWYVLFVIFA